MAIKEEVTLPKQRICSRCHFVSSQEVCKACTLLEGLNKGLPKLGIGKSSKAKRMLEEHAKLQNSCLTNGSITQALEDIDDNTSNHKKKGIKSKKKDQNGLTEGNKNNCAKKNCCKGKCKSTDEKKLDNSKINSLLEQYGLDEKNNSNKAESNAAISNGDLYVEVEEDDSCGGTCGTLGSLSIGF